MKFFFPATLRSLIFSHTGFHTDRSRETKGQRDKKTKRQKDKKKKRKRGKDKNQENPLKSMAAAPLL